MMGAEHPRPMGDWQDHANCKGTDPNIWHPRPLKTANGVVQYSPRTAMHIDAAKLICAACPVITRCAEHARDLIDPQTDPAIYAGRTVYERRNAARKRKAS